MGNELAPILLAILNANQEVCDGHATSKIRSTHSEEVTNARSGNHLKQTVMTHSAEYYPNTPPESQKSLAK